MLMPSLLRNCSDRTIAPKSNLLEDCANAGDTINVTLTHDCVHFKIFTIILLVVQYIVNLRSDEA
jgi:hypothetical protein